MGQGSVIVTFAESDELPDCFRRAKETIDLIRQYREESGIHSGLLSLYNDIIFNVHNMHHMTAVFEP